MNTTLRLAVVAVLAMAGPLAAAAQTTAPPATREATPNAITPPGGIARGVIPPPAHVDPEMVAPPPAPVAPTMPVIKPPGTAR